jgi:hypothetical protein
MRKQLIDSARTARNQVPALHKRVIKKLYGNVLDYGGGQWDKATQWVKDHSEATLFVYDPFNRTKEHNEEVLKNKFDFVLCSNVLNVIREKSVRNDIIHECCKFDVPVFVSIYKAYQTEKYIEEEGQMTKDGWQVCKPLAYYQEEIEALGYTTKKYVGYLKVTK